MKNCIRNMAMFVGVIFLLFLIACAPSVKATDPASVTKSLFDAINKGQAEAAASYFAEDGEFIWSFGQPKGVQKILNYFKTNLIPLKTHVELQDLKVDGDNLTGTFKITSTWFKSAFPNGAPLYKVSGVVQGGKIKSMMWSSVK